MAVQTQIQFRRGLSSSWTGSIVLAAGELGLETDTGRYKIGDGSTIWSSLPYYASSASPSFTGTPTAPTATAGTNSTQIATTAFTSALAYGLTTGLRNKIINGDFRINQRVFTPISTFGTYGHDRWVLSAVDGTTTYSNQSFTTGNAITGYEPTNYAQIVSTGQTLATAISAITQKIEDVRTLAGQQVTVSFWAKALSGTPKVSVELQQDFGTGGAPSADVNTLLGIPLTLSTSWQRFIISTTVPSISSKTIGTDANSSSLGLSLWTSAGTNYNVRTGTLGIQSTTIHFWGIQVEQSPQVTPFEQRPIGVELALCQRYYERIQGIGTASTDWTNIGSGGWDSPSTFSCTYNYLVPKRARPSVFSTTGINCLYHGVAWQPVTSINSYTEISIRAVRINYVCSGTSVQGQAGIAVLASASAFVEVSAEL